MRSSALFQFRKFESKGEYKDIQIELDAVLDGDVDAITIKSSGSTEFTSNVVAKEARLGGACKIGGNCNIDLFHLVGESKIGGNIISNELIVDGKLKCSGKLIEVSRFKLSGSLSLEGCLKSTIVTGKGGFILDKIESEKVDLELNKKTTLKDINSKEVNIIGSKSRGIISKLLSKGDSLIEVNNIYGESITLENIDVKLVKGHNIQIGKNCIIDKVEYTGEINIDNNSKVKEVLKK